MSLLGELQRRKVFKVGAAYAAVGWLVIEVAATIAPQLNFPEWAPRMVTFVILLGFPVALVMAWVFDVTPEGIKVDASKSGSKRVFIVAGILVALALGWFFHRQSARQFQNRRHRTGRRAYPRRQRAEVRRFGTGDRAADRRTHRHASLGADLRSQA